MNKLTKEKVRSNRLNLLKSSTKRLVVNKGNRNVKSIRVCAICGRPLTNYINSSDGHSYYYTLFKHYHLLVDDLIPANICYNVTNCYTELDRKSKSESG